jgi:putative FmdB family regulatory protein
MPTYEYECQACGHAFEELQAMTDKKLIKCPKCHKNKLSRLIGSGSGMIFKGSGFYETDYKKKKGPSQPAASPAPAPKAPCGGSCSCHPH